ncbi:MAG: tRNA (adenosine(37)-N6)-threonylcarbamoyltransferase complex dimerization subunit type 1 TsaB [Paludibacteraceae bacterium]|nr:tRNA (adenosine(37)-N6)-threonylcarbamoyltransferase complex dimerization subunit type 1 TsaB [Paludibacteraceae bacterium]
MQYEPVILGIETSTDACSAAVLRGGQVLASRLHAAGSEHARELPLMVEELLAETKDFPIEAVAVSEGPGSYTGLRIGASVAKGLAYGLNVPLMAVPTLQIMAAQVASQVRDGLLCPMIDARRMEVYNAFYTPELKEVIPVAATIVDEHSFAEQLAAGKVYFFGNGAAKCKSVIGHANAVFLENIVPDAAWIRGGKIVDTAYWEPFYLKAYEAKKATNIIK